MSKAQATNANKPAQAAKSQVEYTLNEENQIVRTDGEGSMILATLGENGSLTYTSSHTRRFHPKVAEFLNDLKTTWNPDLVTVAADENASDLEKDAADISSEHTDEYNAKVGKPPKQSIAQGDKTPRYVEWLRINKPKTFKQRYGVRGPGVVTKYRPEEDPKTGRMVQTPYQENALIAERKTHLTELPAAQVEDENDEDENN